MKKYLWMLGSLLMSFALFTSCSDDDDNAKAQMEKNYFRVENAVYAEGAIPAATTTATLDVEVEKTTVAKGGKNVIRIARDRDYARFYIGVKGMDGYWIYTPSLSASVKAMTRAGDEEWDDFYEIPIDNGNGSVDNYTLSVSAEDKEGNVTKPYEQEINYTEAVATDKPTRIYYTEDGYYSETLYRMQYDSKGRMTRLDCMDDISYTFNYDKKTITEEDEGETYTYKYSTNSQGYITQLKDEEGGSGVFSYDSKGYLQRAELKGDDDRFVAKFTWSDGNLVKVVIEDYMTIIAQYSKHINVGDIFIPGGCESIVSAMTGMLIPMVAGLTGKQSKNLPSIVSDEGEGESYLSYTFNANGTVATLTEKDSELLLHYEYGQSSLTRSNVGKKQDSKARLPKFSHRLFVHRR